MQFRVGDKITPTKEALALRHSGLKRRGVYEVAHIPGGENPTTIYIDNPKGELTYVAYHFNWFRKADR